MALDGGRGGQNVGMDDPGYLPPSQRMPQGPSGPPASHVEFGGGPSDPHAYEEPESVEESGSGLGGWGFTIAFVVGGNLLNWIFDWGLIFY